MLFGSHLFLFWFLPITLAVCHALCYVCNHMANPERNQRVCDMLPRLATYWLAFASLVFCGWWQPEDLTILLLVIAIHWTDVAIIMPGKWKALLKPDHP